MQCDCEVAPEQPPDSEVEQTTKPPALAPHRYPAWIWLVGLGILATLAVALYELPPYYRAATLVQQAETFAAHGQNKSAVDFFTTALEITPKSKRARLGIALSYFRSADGEDHKKGLEALQGLTIEKDEWAKLSAVMPRAYRSLFTDVKK